MDEKKFFTIKGSYGVLSFMIALLSVLMFFPLLMYPGYDAILALLAILLGCLSLRDARRRGFAIAGIIIGSLVLIYCLFFIIQASLWLFT